MVAIVIRLQTSSNIEFSATREKLEPVVYAITSGLQVRQRVGVTVSEGSEQAAISVPNARGLAGLVIALVKTLNLPEPRV